MKVPAVKSRTLHTVHNRSSKPFLLNSCAKFLHADSFAGKDHTMSESQCDCGCCVCHTPKSQKLCFFLSFVLIVIFLVPLNWPCCRHNPLLVKCNLRLWVRFSSTANSKMWGWNTVCDPLSFRGQKSPSATWAVEKSLGFLSLSVGTTVSTGKSFSVQRCWRMSFCNFFFWILSYSLHCLCSSSVIPYLLLQHPHHSFSFLPMAHHWLLIS